MTQNLDVYSKPFWAGFLDEELRANSIPNYIFNTFW